MTMQPAYNAQRGASAIEFAVCVPLLLLVLWGIVTFANVLHARMIIARAAEDGARSVSFFSAARNYSDLAATPALGPCSVPGGASVRCEVLESLARSLQVYQLGESSDSAAAIRTMTDINVAAGTCNADATSLGIEVTLPFEPLRILPPIYIPGLGAFSNWIPSELSACAVVAL